MQESMVSYSKNSIPLHRFTFIYQPKENKKGAALSFHLTAREKKDISASVFDRSNQTIFQQIMQQQAVPHPQGISKE
jgi:hypothetical protein